jgi:hypothetical protein
MLAQKFHLPPIQPVQQVKAKAGVKGGAVNPAQRAKPVCVGNSGGGGCGGCCGGLGCRVHLANLPQSQHHKLLGLLLSA